jgi:hypothetical protein
MRILAIIALALPLVGCNGDRVRRGTDMQPGQLAFSIHDAQ